MPRLRNRTSSTLPYRVGLTVTQSLGDVCCHYTMAWFERAGSGLRVLTAFSWLGCPPRFATELTRATCFTIAIATPESFTGLHSHRNWRLGRESNPPDTDRQSVALPESYLGIEIGVPRQDSNLRCLIGGPAKPMLPTRPYAAIISHRMLSLRFILQRLLGH